jgi:hypothetical protein
VVLGSSLPSLRAMAKGESRPGSHFLGFTNHKCQITNHKSQITNHKTSLPQAMGAYSILSATMERPITFTSIEIGGRKLLPRTISPRTQVLPPTAPTFMGS